MDEDFFEWDADKMLDVYILDYLARNKLDTSAHAFKAESHLPDRTPPIEVTPHGFLYEWWFAYWDVFFARRFNRQCSADAAAYIETLQAKARERRLQMQQMQVTPKHSEQLPQGDTNLSVLGGSLNAVNSEGMMSPPAASVSAGKMVEERMKHSIPMSSLAPLTPSEFYRMGIPKSVTNHEGHLVCDNSGNASNSLQQVPSTMIRNEGDVNLGATPTSFPKNQSIFEQTMLELAPVLRNAALHEAKTSLAPKDLPRAGIDQPTPSLGVQAQRPNLRDKNRILESDWQRVTARAQAILKQGSKHVQSDRAQLKSGSPEVNMVRAQHSLSQPQQKLQQNDRKRKQSTFHGASTSNIGGIKVSPSPISPLLLDTPESSMQQQLSWMDGTNLLPVNVERFDEGGTSGVNMEFLQSNAGEGFTFVELHCIRTSNSKITCCDFSSDGKFLATAGHDKKACIWNMETFQTESTPEIHKSVISDIRFRPNSSGFATSSFDNCVRLWDAANPKYCVGECGVHNSAVMSLDFHPKKTGLLCVADIESEIKYWDITAFAFIRSFKGGNAKVRFQPGVGQLLAAAYNNGVSIFDAETSTQICSLQGHPEAVSNICWDANGETLASMSPNLVKIWSMTTGECIKEYNSSIQNQFHSCAFHPINSTMLVIGGNSFIELWDMAMNKNRTMHAHEDAISALVHSPVTGIVASASYDGFVKFWK